MEKKWLPCQLALTMTAVLSLALCCNNPVRFSPINSTACIRSDFVQTWSLTSAFLCSIKCAKNPRCQAWSQKSDAAVNECRNFVFDKCSKGVRDCSCADSVMQVFVRQQSALSPGLLCPPDYHDVGSTYVNTLCDRKYKVYDNSGSWQLGEQKCNSEPGLTIMSDVTSSIENDFVYSMRTSSGKSLYLSGKQIPGSAEPGEFSYYWTSCNISVDSAFWATGQPNNNNGGEDYIGVYGSGGLVDARNDLTGVLCECVSPF